MTKAGDPLARRIPIATKDKAGDRNRVEKKLYLGAAGRLRLEAKMKFVPSKPASGRRD